MRRVALEGADARLRARRWDAVIVGGALPGLVAAVRLGMAGLRVLVAEEDTAARTPGLLREPFWLGPASPEGVVESCLRALGVPLIDRRSLEPLEVAYQVIFPDARVDVGAPALTAEELTAWGLADAGGARDLARGLEVAARAEADALLAAPWVRAGLRGAPSGPRPAPRPARLPRGLPAAAADPPAGLAAFFEAQLRSLSDLAAGRPSPEARARLLGAALEGGGSFARPGATLRGLLRKRIEQLHGEFRTVASPFDLVELGGHPGIALRAPPDAWLGRALILNAPRSLLAASLESWEREVPGFLRAPAPTRRRATVWLRALREVVPDALARRALVVRDAAGEDVVRVALHPSERGPRFVEIVASAAAPSGREGLESHHAALEEAVSGLLPFAEGRLGRVAAATPALWDDDLVLAEPEAGGGWPGDVEIRAASRPPVFVLPREHTASLGFEGDLLLGWRAGDAIRTELV